MEVFVDSECRKDGWRSTRLVRRTGWRLSRQRQGKLHRQRTRCKDWKGWMLLVRGLHSSCEKDGVCESVTLCIATGVNGQSNWHRSSDLYNLQRTPARPQSRGFNLVAFVASLP